MQEYATISNEYSHSKEVEILKMDLFLEVGKLTLEDIISVLRLYRQEWGFPKGRRNLRETDREAAVRECNEETGLRAEDYKIVEDAPKFQEVFLGTNNIRYKHIYFLANYDSEKALELDLENSVQLLEISCVSWFSLEECLIKIRNYNMAKKELIKNVDEYLSNSIIIREPNNE